VGAIPAVRGTTVRSRRKIGHDDDCNDRRVCGPCGGRVARARRAGSPADLGGEQRLRYVLHVHSAVRRLSSRRVDRGRG